MPDTKYEDRHRALTESARDYDTAFQMRDWQTIENWPEDRDPNALDDFEERTSPLVDKVVVEAREVVSRFIGYAEGKYVAPLDKALVELDEEASK